MNTTWYKTYQYNIIIEPVEVISETEAFITVLEKHFSLSTENSTHKARRRKDNEYHKTFADARTYLMDRNTAEIKKHEQAIEKLRIEAGKIFMMEPVQ